MKRASVWLLLLGAPVVLGAAFAPFLFWFTMHEGAKGEELAKSLQRIAVFPSLLGFGGLLIITRALAKRDGVALGWSRPGALELVIGLGVGVCVAVLDQLWLYPLIRSAQPSFDPTVSQVQLVAVVVTLLIAVSAEDTLYRGYALSVLRERHGGIIAGVVTSLFYALLTPGGGWPLMLWALGFGAVLATVRVFSRTLWPVMFAHLIVALSPRLLATA